MLASIGPIGETESERLGALLKRCRARIDRNRRSLGPFLRLPMRIGKTVTQEEIAEAAGITRQWYAMMETSHPVHVSTAVLARIADSLMMDRDERSMLFRLAVPELRGSTIADRSASVLDAFASVRRVARRLFVATTEAEALLTVSEAVAAEFHDPDFIGSYTRIAPGAWQFPAVLTSDSIQKRVGGALGSLYSGLSPEQIDEAMLSTLLVEPGQVGTRSELYRDFALEPLISNAFSGAGLPGAEFIMAHVRSKRGFEANLFAACFRRPRPFSEIERAQLSTLADLTSLALS